MSFALQNLMLPAYPLILETYIFLVPEPAEFFFVIYLIKIYIHKSITNNKTLV